MASCSVSPIASLSCACLTVLTHAADQALSPLWRVLPPQSLSLALLPWPSSAPFHHSCMPHSLSSHHAPVHRMGHTSSCLFFWWLRACFALALPWSIVSPYTGTLLVRRLAHVLGERGTPLSDHSDEVAFLLQARPTQPHTVPMVRNVREWILGGARVHAGVWSAFWHIKKSSFIIPSGISCHQARNEAGEPV